MFGREVPVERSLGHPDIGGDLGNAGSATKRFIAACCSA
jgi:hypothetical protein